MFQVSHFYELVVQVIASAQGFDVSVTSFAEKLVISSLQSRTRPLTAVCWACKQVLILWFALTELNNVCACARLWLVKRVKRILSRWHVWFLFCGFWAFFIFRTTSKNFLHPLNIFSKISFLILNTGNRKMLSTTTKCLGTKSQPLFSPQISPNFKTPNGWARVIDRIPVT